MFALGALSFAAPVALLALAALPLIWWLLRIIPPAPKRIRFPAIRLIMRLANPEESSAITPLWLTLLRLALVTFLILGAAHPVINAGDRLEGTGPLVIVIDDGWASAKNWPARQNAAANILDRAERDGRAVAVVTTAPGEDKARALESLMTADKARQTIQALKPKPWPVDRRAAASVLGDIETVGEAHLVWLSNGLDENSAAEFARALSGLGKVTVLADPPGNLPSILLPPLSVRDGLTIRARKAPGSSTRRLSVRVRGEDGGVLAQRALTFETGKTEARLKLPMPPEIRNRVTHIEIENGNHAGAMVLVDERWRRRPVGLATDAGRRVDQPLLDDLFYLDRALDPFTEVRTGSIIELLRRELAVLVLADPGRISGTSRRLMQGWMADGGLVLRFAGPRLAGVKGPLLPVRLRQGDRELGGALSWTKPASLAPFPETSPFAGLAVPKDVKIRRQVLAQPSVDLPEKTWARLTDGTPIVTAERRGKGWLVFVHTTPSPNWSNLPLSGLYVGMLQNLVRLSRGVGGGADDRLLAPLRSVDGFGALGPARTGARAIKANRIAATSPGPDHPPGFYGDESARRAFNLTPKLAALTPIGTLSGVTMGSYQATRERDLRGPLLAAALLLALADIIASFALRGFFTRRRAVAGLVKTLALAAIIAGLMGIAGWSGPARAQSRSLAPPVLPPDTGAFASALTVRIAYVRTGDRKIDDTSHAGLRGLAYIANARTAAELGAPAAIDPAVDDLSFYPLIYWPITEDAAQISAETAERLNKYMKTGGTIFFDTRDQSGTGIGANRLEEIARGIDAPPMQAVPGDHVLTKAYYLLREFPGRWKGGRLWVARKGAANDGVSPIIVGSNDWAGAWAIDASRRPLYPVAPGGSRQREMAYRFGINLLMYVLTGNYKADQVHLPAILERLGQ
ncbi:MAG: DUF4159 domain-containing protein [Rhodospirillales bacterium]|nr:DUF4159 domain-containing protein [Rhodospirillales bacterium]MDP6643895.1 DUF4159 domain-containing protein [Rhodospirillales bacterium]